MMFLSQNWYFSVQKTLIYYTFNKSHHNSFILLVFSHVANFRYVANFTFLTLSPYCNFTQNTAFFLLTLMYDHDENQGLTKRRMHYISRKIWMIFSILDCLDTGLQSGRPF